MAVAPAEVISFVSLGETVIYEMRFPGKPPLVDVLGGRGVHATLGARLFTGATRSKTVGCYVRVGNDFPSSACERLQDWKTAQYRVILDTPSTKALWEFGDTSLEPRKCKYLVKPIMSSTTTAPYCGLLCAKAIHFHTSPEQVIHQVSELIAIRKEVYSITEKPFIIWKPVTAEFRPQNLSMFLKACTMVDVFSTTHVQMATLFSQHDPTTCQPENLETDARIILGSAMANNGSLCVIVRSAEHGCLVTSLSEGSFWLPPFYAANAPEIINTSGADGAFLGGFAIGYQKNNSPVEAAAHGNVAASFAVEQIGLPGRQSWSNSEGDEVATWNNKDVNARLEMYRARLQKEGKWKTEKKFVFRA